MIRPFLKMAKFRLQGEISIRNKFCEVQLCVFDETLEINRGAKKSALRLIQEKIDQLVFPRGLRIRIKWELTKIVSSGDCKFIPSDNLFASQGDLESHEEGLFTFHYQNQN